MSIFASRTTITVDLPFDPPHHVVVQKLAGRHLEKARSAFLTQLMLGVQERGGAAVQKELMELFADRSAAKQVEQVKSDPLNGFDKYSLVRYGVKAWSYPEPVTPEAIEDLDEDAVDFLAAEILKLSKPGLFQTAAQIEEATGNA